MGIEQNIRNARLVTGGLASYGTNAPAQYSSKQKQYLATETKDIAEKIARYSSDFVLASVQGLDPNDPLAWGEYYIRMADVVNPSASITRRFSNYKAVMFADRTIQYIRPGTKIVCMGNTWLATNPQNISGSNGSGIVQRCNAIWNHLDWYGNVLREPLVVEPERANANDSDAQESMYIRKGYFNVVCQYNGDTAQIDENTRMILGKSAYRVTGFSDFMTEFTEDDSSVRTLAFTIRFSEPCGPLDDMERRVSGGREFTWQIRLNGAAGIVAGQTAQFAANSYRNGESVASSPEHPVSYFWTSSNPSVARVDANGLVTGIGSGEATITAALEQNPELAGSFRVSVTDAKTGVFFTSTVPETIYAFDEATIGAAWFENGAETEDEIEFSFSGATEGSYGFFTGPKAVTIYGYDYSETPLVITAKHGTVEASAQIRLGAM